MTSSMNIVGLIYQNNSIGYLMLSQNFKKKKSVEETLTQINVDVFGYLNCLVE